MKKLVPKKQIKNRFDCIIKIGYCELESLLTFCRPFAYSAGVYGWACDYYEFGPVCLSVGYDPIGRAVDYSIVKAYNDIATKILAEKPRGEQQKALDTLIAEFIAEVAL